MFLNRFVCIGTVLALGGLLLTGGCKKKEAKAAPVPAVVVEPAVEMDFADSVTEVGVVQAYETVDLSANVSGFLTEVNFQEGQLVKKGTKLFQIDPQVYDAAVNKADADVKKAEAELTNRTIEFNRQKDLLKTNATSKRNYDTAEMHMRTASADLVSKKAILAQSKVDQGYTKILAPFDGYVGFKKYSAGNMVGPSSGALAVITASGNVKIYFSMDELAMLKIQKNYPKYPKAQKEVDPKVSITLQDGEEYKEKVWISAWNNMVKDGTFQLQLTAENPKRLLMPGQYVKVNLQVSPLRKQVMVKQEAILREQLGNFVFVVNAQNKIERRKITVGMKNGDFQVVLSGLKPGEKIVTEGLQKARPGDTVRTIAPKSAVPGKALTDPAAAPGNSAEAGKKAADPGKKAAPEK